MHLKTESPEHWASFAWVDKIAEGPKNRASQPFHSSASLPD